MGHSNKMTFCILQLAVMSERCVFKFEKIVFLNKELFSSDVIFVFFLSSSSEGIIW